MKVEFKHNCEIQGKKFGFEKHMSPGIHEVPASFIFDWFFVALVLEQHAKILEAPYSEFEEFSEEELAKVDKKFIELLSKFLEDDSEEEKGESDDENSEDDSDSDDDSDADNEDDSDLSSEESEEETETVTVGEVSKTVTKKKSKKKGKR